MPLEPFFTTKMQLFKELSNGLFKNPPSPTMTEIAKIFWKIVQLISQNIIYISYLSESAVDSLCRDDSDGRACRLQTNTKVKF